MRSLRVSDVQFVDTVFSLIEREKLPMPNEEKRIDLPEKLIAPKDLTQIPISFVQPAKILEIQHSATATLLSVLVGDKWFPDKTVEGEVVPAGVPVVFTFGNAAEDARRVRAAIYVEMEVQAQAVSPAESAAPGNGAAAAAPAQDAPSAHAALAEIMGVPVVPPGAPPPSFAAEPPPPPAPAPPGWQPPQAADPNTPPPPGQSASYQLGNQQVTVTTPAQGAAHPPNGTQGVAAPQAAPPMIGGVPIPPMAGRHHEPPPPGGVSSFALGNQQVTVTTPGPVGTPAGHSATQAIRPVIQPRVQQGPETVSVGVDEVAILLKRGDAENLLKLIRGAVLYPPFTAPIEGAVARALGHQP